MSSAFLRPLRAFTTLVLLLTASAAGAHSPPEQAVAFHGGIAYTTEAFNLELLAEDGRLRVYVRDRHNRPLDVSGSNAKALAGRDRAEAERAQRTGGRVPGCLTAACDRDPPHARSRTCKSLVLRQMPA